MKPWITFLCIIPLFSGVMANGGENWHVPPAIKAATVFEIIWFVVLLGLFATILRRLHFVPPGRNTRAPYILLSVVTGALSISYLLSGILLKVSNTGYGIPSQVRIGLTAFSMSLSHIDLAFEPAVCLWLIHLRGQLTSTTEGKPFKLWVSQYWKRIVDWSLVATTFILAISKTAIMNNVWMKLFAHHMDYYQLMPYLVVDRRLNLAVVAFALLLAIDITASLAALKVTQRRVYFIDPITTRLVVAVLPFVVFRFIESLIVTIYPETYRMRYADPSVLILVTIIFDGVCSIGVIGGLASTMTIPHVLWVPGATTSTTALPGAGYTRH